MRDHDRWQSASDEPSHRAAPAPGKRTLTQGLPPRAAEPSRPDPDGGYRASRATFAGPPAADDPFALHRIDL